MFGKVNFLDPTFTGACGFGIYWRGLGLLWVGGVWVCFAGLQVIACAGGSFSVEFAFIVEASTGRASPSFSYVDLLSLLVGVAAKICQGFPVAPSLRDSCTSDNMRIQCRCGQQYKCLLVENQLP
eukprot:1150676-Pelagomonas_calceolata.AAC.2